MKAKQQTRTVVVRYTGGSLDGKVDEHPTLGPGAPPHIIFHSHYTGNGLQTDLYQRDYSTPNEQPVYRFDKTIFHGWHRN